MKLIFLGDSLMQYNDESTFPQTGWPQMISSFLKPERKIEIKNFAKNGRSTKSFLDEKRFDEALVSVSENDIVFISFSHNDEKKEDETRYTIASTSYKENLNFMYDKVKEKKADVIFVTPVTRLKYDEKGNLLHTHLDYPKYMKELADELKITYIDLEKITYELLSKEDYMYNSKYYMILEKDRYDNYKEGLKDTTHLNRCGADFISFLVYRELKKNEKYKDLFM